MTTIENPMGTQPIKKLLMQLAIPAMIANVVNALYNIVDQIFIGQGVGYLGNAATNIAFPITTICLALGLMTGVGAASNFNLELGRKEVEKARKIAGTAVIQLIVMGIAVCLLVQIFLAPLMQLFGATDQIFDYAIEYSRITAYGIPFFLFSTEKAAVQGLPELSAGRHRSMLHQDGSGFTASLPDSQDLPPLGQCHRGLHGFRRCAKGLSA